MTRTVMVGGVLAVCPAHVLVYLPPTIGERNGLL